MDVVDGGPRGHVSHLQSRPQRRWERLTPICRRSIRLIAVVSPNRPHHAAVWELSLRLLCSAVISPTVHASSPTEWLSISLHGEQRSDIYPASASRCTSTAQASSQASPNTRRPKKYTSQIGHEEACGPTSDATSHISCVLPANA